MTSFVVADVEVVTLTIQDLNLHNLVVCLVMTVWFSMTFHMLYALLFVLTILARQPLLQ